MLPGSAARVLLTVVWTGALLGAAFQVLWIHAPRWLYVPLYLVAINLFYLDVAITIEDERTASTGAAALTPAPPTAGRA